MGNYERNGKPQVRWDRKLREKMAFDSASLQVPVEPAAFLGGPKGGAVKQYLIRKIKGVLKGPIFHLRDFIIAPICIRLDAYHNVALVQQKLSSEFADRLECLDRALECLDRAVAKQAADLAELQNALPELQNARRDLGYLHQKYDESARKARPVVHFDGAYAVPLADGYLFIPEEEENLILMYTGATSAGLEPGTRRILQAVVAPGGRAVDVGAGVGLHTIALAQAAGQTGRVEAFEAEARLEPFLKRTIAANGFSQIRLHSFALGAHEATAPFYVAHTIGHSSLYKLESGEQVREQATVRVTSLDAALDTTLPVDVIKIDVEGAELDVVRGARVTLERSPECTIVAECGPSHLQRTNTTIEDWFAEFAGYGFAAYGIVEPSGCLFRLDPQWAARQHSINVLFVRPDSGVERKLIEEIGLLVSSP